MLQQTKQLAVESTDEILTTDQAAVMATKAKCKCSQRHGYVLHELKFYFTLDITEHRDAGNCMYIQW